MRFSLRKALQVIFFFTCMLLMNLFYLVLINEGRNAGQDVGQNGDRSAGLRGGPHAGRVLGHQRKRLSVDRDKRFVNSSHVNSSVDETAEGKLKRAKDYVDSNVRKTELSDIYISVKTTKKFHEDRVQLLLETWYILAKENTFFFTDAEDELYKEKTRNHLINTNCSSVHTRKALCCKLSVEYDYFMASGKRWFCHVDDDTYVNVPGLVKLLQNYNHTQDWYLGKPSLNHPLEITNIENASQRTAFWFATGGAGFCLSRGLALKMVPFTGGGKLKTVCEKIRLPDDCTIGFIVYYYLNKELTVIPGFHSHLEGLWRVRGTNLEEHLTFSYAPYRDKMNIVDVPGFNGTYDPTRFRSIHCALYPNFSGCPQKMR